jgi:D-alanyl-D-alanine dipeptidase
MNTSNQIRLPEDVRVSLQEVGFSCENYYWGKRGKDIGITREEFATLGIHDETMWVHRWVIEPLLYVQDMIIEKGYGIVIKDAFRPRGLYRLIGEKREALGLPISLFNFDDTPHSTGMAVDVVLVDENGDCPWMRDDSDGDGCHAVDFYRPFKDPVRIEYQRLQDILVLSMLKAGFWLASKREYWHWQLYDADSAPCF